MPKDKYEPPNPQRMHKIMSSEEAAAGKKNRWPELKITGIVRNLSPALWKFHHLTSLFLNDNNLSHIPPDISKLENLSFLDLSCNKLCSLPAELGHLVHLRELLLNNNCLRGLPFELGKLFQLQNLGLNGNPLSSEIFSLYNEPNGMVKLLTYMLDNLAVSTAVPPQRPWIHFDTLSRTRPTGIFTVMSYNVLCDKYATRQIYGYCPSWALNWDYRKKCILEEIINYGADIISLQEIETEQYYSFFLPELKQMGYDGVFSPKSRAKTMLESERRFVDGCAIFYRTSKFSLIKEHLVEFNQIAMAKAEGSEEMLNRVMTKDNIGLAALLETKEAFFETKGLPPDIANSHLPLLVANVHIHWDPEYSDVKLIQTMMFMNELKNIIEEHSQSFRPGASTQPDVNSIPLVLCGDLNSLPDSGVVEYLCEGKVSANHDEFKDMGNEPCLTHFTSKEKINEFHHPFKISRAYDGASSSIMNTNYTFDFKGVIDYMFYSSQHMHPLGVLGTIDNQWFEENRIVGCPHPSFPSDHFSLLAEFELYIPYMGNNSLVSHR